MLKRARLLEGEAFVLTSQLDETKKAREAAVSNSDDRPNDKGAL